MKSEYTILTVNPGSTGTKIGIVTGSKVVLDKNVDNLPGEFDGCKSFGEQIPVREKKILKMLEDENINLDKIDAVSGRGVGVRSCTGGTYIINDRARDDALNDVEGINHPATLGIVLSYNFGKKLGKPAYFVNPMNTDELCDSARITGVKGLYRPAHSHPLNSKQVGIHHSEIRGRRYEDCNYVIAHMGGGVSISAHCHGKMVDSTRIGDGQGSISPNRAGDICFDDVVALTQRGMTLQEVGKFCSKKGGLMELCGTDDLRKVAEMMSIGDQKAILAFDAMEYTMAKWIAMMAGALKGKVDGILLTGGLAHDKELVRRLTNDCQWIAPISIYPGSFETEALAAGAQRVLRGEEQAKTYTGVPVFTGFGIPEWENH